MIRPASQEGGRNGSSKLKILWFINLDYRAGMRHGGNLRYFNYSNQLSSRGHEVYFVVNKNKSDTAEEKRRFLDDLKAHNTIAGYFEIDYWYPRRRGRLASLTGHPTLLNRLLQKYQESTKNNVKEIIARHGINLCIFSDRSLLFLLPELPSSVRTIIDWVDSFVLYRIRETIASFKRRELASIPVSLRYLVDAFVQESHYGRRCDANIVVSPVDKGYLDLINRVPEKNKVLLNGVKTKDNGAVRQKIRNRLIFTGNMDFPPNYEAAIWFIDNVLPILLQRRGEIELVVAGANPVEKLLMRASRNVKVTGYVEDIQREIAESDLYVAPLVSGGGFKNKVVEALASGTFVIATSMAVEFLGRDLRELLLIADTPGEMAELILSYLDDPGKFDGRLERLKQIICEEFRWEHRTEELINIAMESFQCD